MARIYTSYSEKEFFFLQAKAKEMGMTPSAFQKYCALLNIGLPTRELENIDLAPLKELMERKLNATKVNEPFIVSALLPPEQWTTLNRSQKITLSIHLKRIIEQQPEKFKHIATLHNNIKQYIKYTP